MKIESRSRCLVTITGPVGGGKSTVGKALAGHLREHHAQKVAVVDLDLVYMMLCKSASCWEEEMVPIARSGCMGLAQSFFSKGINTVIIEGEFFSEQEFDQLVDGFNTSITQFAFTLHVSYEETLRRVSGDCGRGASKDPLFLKKLHDSFREALPYLQKRTIVVDAEKDSPGDLALSMADHLFKQK